MTRTTLVRLPASRVFALFVCIIFVAPAAFTIATPPVRAVTAVTEVGPVQGFINGILGQDTISAIKNTLSAALDVSNTAANVAKQIKSYVLDPIAFITSNNLLKSITSSILGFVGGKNGSGKPLYVSNLRAYLQNVGDVEAYNFLNQFQSQSNSPFKGAITSSLRANYLQSTTLAGFFAANKSTLNKYSSDPLGFSAGNWQLGGIAAWFGLTTVPQNNPYILYYRASDQLDRQYATAQAAKLAQANWGQGILSYCGSIEQSSGDGTGGDYGGGGDVAVTCPADTEQVGSGGCACTKSGGCDIQDDGQAGYSTGTYILPVGYSCPQGTTFDDNTAGCRSVDTGELTVPNDSSGNPAYPPTATVSDFKGSGDPANGTANLGTAPSGGGSSNVTVSGNAVGKITTADTQALQGLLGTAANTALPAGWRVDIFSAERNTNVGNGGGISQHALGDAVDFRIIKADGTPIPDRGADTSGYYQKVAVAAYNAATPSQQSALRWGGCFATVKDGSTPDLMHLDFGLKNGAPKGSFCNDGLQGLAGGGSPLSSGSTALASAAGASGSSLLTSGSYATPSASNNKIPQPGDPCTKKDGSEGKIQTPGSIIKDYLSKALTTLGIDKNNFGDISASISGIMKNVGTIFSTINMATSLFGGSNGISGFSGTGTTYETPFQKYLNDSSYMGYTVSDLAASSAASGLTGTDLASRVRDYRAAWATMRTAANGAKASLNNLVNSCPTQSAAAQAAIDTSVDPVLTRADSADTTAAAADALLAQVASEGATGSSLYAADFASLATAAPSTVDVTKAEQDAAGQSSARAIPEGSLSVAGGTTVDVMNLLKANADALAASSISCPPPSTNTNTNTNTSDTTGSNDGG